MFIIFPAILGVVVIILMAVVAVGALCGGVSIAFMRNSSATEMVRAFSGITFFVSLAIVAVFIFSL